MALICQKLTATSLLFFFLLFSPLVVASVVVSILPEQRRGEESSRAHLQKGCRWARETRGVLCVCSCLALHTSAKLGSSIRSVVWACWMKWIEREWERVRESEGDRGVLVLSQWFSVTSLSLVLPSSASLLSVSSFETGQGIRVKPSRSASLCRSPRCCRASLEQRLDPVKKQGRDREKS